MPRHFPAADLADVGTPDPRVGEKGAVTRTWNRVFAILAVALTALTIWPIVDAGRAALDLNWIPSGDWAVLTLRVEDVGRATPLVGPYSRFGWNHPGPLLYWLLALPSHLFGGAPRTVLAAAAALNSLSVAAIGALSWRRGRFPLVALSMSTLAILFHAFGPALLRDPWNPFLTLLPLAVLVLLAWSLIEGDVWMWPAIVVVSSFLLQSHIGYLPIIAMIALSTSVIAWRWTSLSALAPTGRRQRTWLLSISIALAALCWLPVLVDQLFGTGNLTEIWRYFASEGDRPAGLATALSTASDQLRIPAAPWLGRVESAGSDGALLGTGLVWLIVPLGAFVLSGWFAMRRRAYAAVRFQLIVGAATLGGVIATARVVGPLFDWVVRWWWVLAALWWLSILWSLWTALMASARASEDWYSRRTGTIATALLSLAAIVVISLNVRPVVDDVASTPPPSPSAGIVLAEFLEPTLDALRGSGPLLVITTGSVRGDYGDALRLQLERSGIEVVAEPDMETHLGPERSESRRTPVATLWIVSADAIASFRTDPTMIELGGWDPLTADQRAAFETDKRLLQDQLIAAGRVDLAEALTNGGGGVDVEAVGLPGVDRELLTRVEKIRRMGDPVAVFLGPSRS